jgi:hypothetical protein
MQILHRSLKRRKICGSIDERLDQKVVLDRVDAGRCARGRRSSAGSIDLRTSLHEHGSVVDG